MTLWGLTIILALSIGANLYFIILMKRRHNHLSQVNNAIVHTMRHGVIETDVHGVIQIFNPAASAMLGYSPEEVIGKVTPAILHDSDEVIARAKEMGIEPGFDVFVKNSREQGVVETRDWTYYRKDKSKFISQLSISTLKNNEIIIGYVGVFDDVTQQKKWENAQEMKDSFLAKIGHELRTPLNAILGLSGLALDSKNDLERIDYIQKMKSSGESLADLINRVLDFSKIEKGMMSLSPVTFDLYEMFQGLVPAYEMQAKEKAINFKWRNHLKTNTKVLADSLRLKQIVSNFLSNALKFTEVGEIKVEVEYDDFVLDIVISDTGIGIPEDKISKLFSPFFQVDETITRRFGGTGLGLAISHELIEMMGGSIYVESTEGVGSTFYLKIPVTRVQVEEVKVIDNSENVIAINFKSSKVLVVEDNKINQLVIRKLLEKWGLEVDVVENGEEAVAKVNDGHGLVFMDIQMPVMDGLSATKIWRKMGNLTPIVALTANSFEQEKQACFEAGMDDFVAKPINPEGLQKILKKYLAA